MMRRKAIRKSTEDFPNVCVIYINKSNLLRQNISYLEEHVSNLLFSS